MESASLLKTDQVQRVLSCSDQTASTVYQADYEQAMVQRT